MRSHELLEVVRRFVPGLKKQSARLFGCAVLIAVDTLDTELNDGIVGIEGHEPSDAGGHAPIRWRKATIFPK